MSLKLKNKKLIKVIVSLWLALLAVTTLFGAISSTVWSDFDYKVLDLFYRQAITRGHGPSVSPRIIYIPITDNSYDTFGKHYSDRKDLARLNNVLTELAVEAAAYDIIFARPSEPAADQLFSQSIENHGKLFLPIGLKVSDQPRDFHWQTGISYDKLRHTYLGTPVERKSATPYYAVSALMQHDAFSKAAHNSGHISAWADPDGVYRHMIMLVKVDAQYFPSLSLSIFLDYAGVSFEDVTIDWGHHIIVPATPESFLEKDVRIPIDARGRAFVPFARKWDNDFKKMEAHALLAYYEDENLRGNLLDFFEGNFVFIGDISIGVADLGQTPLEVDVPLITLHAALLNGMITNTFYDKWSAWQVGALVGLISVLLVLGALPRSSGWLYLTGLLMGGALGLLTWIQIIHFHLFPVVTAGAATFFIFIGLTIGLEVAVSRDKAFIRRTFARYVPEKVVQELLSNPQALRLGGEERVISVLFSDISDFTTISEKIPPPELAGLLNEYLTEMTAIVFEHDGIIDKFEGDAIMAEFGAPIPVPGHADKAVMCGLKMQSRLRELRKIWVQKGRPALRCRVGINTGAMIVGNMGSNQVFDYTVIGDAVNLASRLEGANKRYHTGLMISEFTHRALTDGLFKTRVLDVIKVKGKTKAVKVFEVYGMETDRIPSEDARYYGLYQAAFDTYLEKNFTTSREKFTAALAIRPDDPAAAEMITRIDALNRNTLPEDWDGSIALTSK